MAAPSTAPTIPENSSLADILVAQNAMKPNVAQDVKNQEIQSGKSQEVIIKEQKLVSDEELTKARAVFYNVPYIDITTASVDPQATASLTQEVAERFGVFPVSIDPVKKELLLVMKDPLDLQTIEFVEQKTNLRVKPATSEDFKIDEAIQTRFTGSLSEEVTEALKEVAPKGGVKTLDATSQTGLIRQERISEVVTHILDFAVRSRASDIHIEPQEKTMRVRYRVDGILQEKLTIPKELQDSVISRIKILSNMKIDEKRIPQDGRFNFKNQDEEVDLRVSSLPTAWGEKIVMRLLPKGKGVPELSELGLRGQALKVLQDSILRPHGIITICGPTGSGKTTTLYSILQKLNTPKVNIVTLEDPIEYKMVGINQVQVNLGVGLTFASGLRAFLRQDPNIILVGEIRDRETADLAIQASLTGHLVFSTLHTNDAAGALPRLLDLGAEPFLLTSSMTAIVAQRVLRKIDPDNKEEYIPDAKVIEDIKTTLGSLMPTTPIKLYRGKPTAENNNSGYLGRVGIYEVMSVTPRIGKLILEKAPAEHIDEAARQEGMITLKQDGFLKALEGLTSIEEVLRVAEE